jgi:hypothetical protein
MAPGIEVADGFKLRVTAIDATTGDTVSGVNVSNVVITGDDLTGSGGDVTIGDVEPLFTPLPANLFASGSG